MHMPESSLCWYFLRPMELVLRFFLQGQLKAILETLRRHIRNMVLAIAFFVKLGTAYFDYRKSGQFEWTATAILFACLVFTLTAPTYIWGIVGL